MKIYSMDETVSLTEAACTIGCLLPKVKRLIGKNRLKETQIIGSRYPRVTILSIANVLNEELQQIGKREKQIKRSLNDILMTLEGNNRHNYLNNPQNYELNNKNMEN